MFVDLRIFFFLHTNTFTSVPPPSVNLFSGGLLPSQHLQETPALTCVPEDIWEYRACLPQPRTHPAQTDHRLIMAFPDPRAQKHDFRISPGYEMFSFASSTVVR